MRPLRGLTALSIAVLLSLTLLAGCGMEFTPTGPSHLLITPKALPDADRAVAAARDAGKATQCPEAFQEVEKQRYSMYFYYRFCGDDAAAIAAANDVIAKANALCPVKVQAPPPPPPSPPPPSPPPAPTATISATSPSIQQGACTTLTWSSTGASSATVDPGLGGVALSGSQQVCPPSTTDYAISASGPGGTARATTTVSVTPPSPPPPAPKVIDRLTIHVNFDFDKANIRSADVAEAQKALDFVKKYPGSKVSIQGHTDGIGTVPYNEALSERRAAAVKTWLVDHGADGSRMQTVGYGKSRPIADNSTPEGRFQNRRVEILIISE